MKAATRHRYGPPEVLQIRDIEKPVPKENEILVKVHATTVNRTDCGGLTGKPFAIQLFTGLGKPKRQVPGTDFAGEIEAVGENISRFKIGDKVWGFNDNGLASQAQYLTISEDTAILKISENISFEEAAAAPEGAYYAYNFINKVNLQKGQKVLVNGATGAIGSAALQFLKFYGIETIATANTKNMELVKSLGANEVINWEKEDFTKRDEQFDFIFDAVGKSTFGKCKPPLKPNGIYISTELGSKSENIWLAILSKFKSGKKVIFPMPSDIKRSMDFIQKLLEEGKFKPVIERTFALDEILEAYQYVMSGQKTGNVILKPWEV